MTEEMKVILQLMKSLITGEKNVDIAYKSLDWSEMFSIACRNGIAPFLFDQVAKISETIPIDESIMQMWKQHTMQITLCEYAKTYALRKIINQIKEAKHSMIVFKGPVLASLYPNYALRASSDTDILIKEEEKYEIFTIVENLGYQRVLESEGNVYTFENEKYGHKLELHTSLYAEHTGPRIDILNNMDLINEESLIQAEACGIQLTMLGYENQLIYLMFHMFKHFTLDGIPLRNVIDVILYINKYIEKISINKFWKAMKALGYDSCCKVFFSVGIRYMGLDVRILNGTEVKENKVCKDLLLDIFNFRTYKGKRRQAYQLAEIMKTYMVGNNVEIRRQPQKDMYLRIFRPINKNYNYAKRHKILIPVSWIHKLAKYFYYNFILNNAMYTPRKTIKVAEKRIQLLKEVGLIEKAE